MSENEELNETVDRHPAGGADEAALSKRDATTLAKCEQVVSRGLNTFVEVGAALLTIRDQKLYRGDYASFESYCDLRWDISRSRAYQLIDASRVTNDLSTFVDTPLPETESQARELVGLSPALAALVMQQVAGTNFTAKDLRTVRQSLKTPPTPKVLTTEQQRLKDAKALLAAAERITALVTAVLSHELTEPTAEEAKVIELLIDARSRLGLNTEERKTA